MPISYKALADDRYLLFYFYIPLFNYLMDDGWLLVYQYRQWTPAIYLVMVSL